VTGYQLISRFILVLILFFSTGCQLFKSQDIKSRDCKMLIEKSAPSYSIWENNRKVAWLDAGDPFGFPVFYAHGSPGCRLEVLFLDEKAKQYGLRLIVFDRPGLGKSDYIEGYPLLSFAKDLERLANEKGIKEFGLIGWSSGGPPVLASAYHMPERVRFVFSISGYTNFGEYDDSRQLMAQYHLYGPELSENRHWLLDRFVEIVRWMYLYLPDFSLKWDKEYLKDADRWILNDPDIANIFICVQEEALTAGTKGVIQDLETEWEAWEFSLKEIKVPVHIFQGKQDVLVPWQFAEHLAGNIPNASLHMYENRGHFFSLWPEYQDELFELARSLIDKPIAKLKDIEK